MREKNILVYFVCKSCNPLKKDSPSFPATFLKKLRFCQPLSFWKFSRGLNPPSPPPHSVEREGVHTLGNLTGVWLLTTIDVSLSKVETMFPLVITGILGNIFNSSNWFANANATCFRLVWYGLKYLYARKLLVKRNTRISMNCLMWGDLVSITSVKPMDPVLTWLWMLIDAA